MLLLNIILNKLITLNLGDYVCTTNRIKQLEFQKLQQLHITISNNIEPSLLQQSFRNIKCVGIRIVQQTHDNNEHNNNDDSSDTTKFYNIDTYLNDLKSISNVVILDVK